MSIDHNLRTSGAALAPGIQAGGRLRRTLAAGVLMAGLVAAEAVDFVRDVEPLFVKRCSECHGPDQQKGSLRLDGRSAALRPGKSGKLALVPRDPGASELLRRVQSTDPDEVMPAKGARLTAAEIETLRAWIAAGADWPEVDPRRHWSFQPVARPNIPELRDRAWVRNEIDAFVRARQEREGLSPRPEADRRALIRRLSLDLTGLPPSWAEVEAFVNDPSPGAYEALVERLFRSPHHGEHLARRWLDVARYADSNGYQVDLTRSIWPYRDWVIRAFGGNMPFDRFTVEQLAGDLLPNPTQDQLVATGFNRNTKINDEGGGDAEEYRDKAVKDRVATLGTTWLGLTLMCAECHSHKYDPITHEDYYRLYAFFNQSTDGGNYNVQPVVEVPVPDRSQARAYVAERRRSLNREVAAAEALLPERQKAWEERARSSGEPWTVLALTNVISTGGSSYTNLADGSVLGTGVNPIYDTITMEAVTSLSRITAIRLEVLPDASLPKNGPGRWGQTGNFILDEFSVSAIPAGGGVMPAETNVVFSGAAADWEQLYYRADHAVDRNPKTGWAIGPKFGEAHFLVAEAARPVGFEGGTRLGLKFEHYHGSSHCIGRFRISVTTEPDPVLRWPVDAVTRALLAVPEAERTEEQRRELAVAYRKVSPELRRLERERARLDEREKALEATPRVSLVMKERDERRVTQIHQRGNFLDKGAVVEAGVPAVFSPLPAGGATNRLALARWLVDPVHPLTARVTVNRFWEQIFGVGLVKTSEDFGRQGEVPSHPELLDWLAREFMDSGWDVRAVLRKIVMSATYRQDAAADRTRLEKDFYNRLLTRGARFRMDGEMIRDHALAVSGLLNREVGGPSVHPVQVANLWKEIGFLRPEIGMDEWPLSAGPDLYRRGVYTFWRRVCTYPLFATFDAPSRDVCLARRTRTNTPLQALAALNEPTLVEAARVFAQRILVEGGASPEQQVEFAFRTCLSRPPTPAEQARVIEYYRQQLWGFEIDPHSAETLIRAGSAPRPEGLDARRLAAWMMVANALLNLDETLTKG